MLRREARPLPNVWLGVSAESQAWADQRIPHLLKTPAALRFLSAEPLLQPLDLEPYLNPVRAWSNRWLNAYPLAYPAHRLDWVIAGGESGADARPMNPVWARQLRDQCAAAGVAYFFKQWGAWGPVEVEDLQNGDWFHNFGEGQVVLHVGKKAAGRRLDGVTHDAMPVAHA